MRRKRHPQIREVGFGQSGEQPQQEQQHPVPYETALCIVLCAHRSVLLVER